MSKKKVLLIAGALVAVGAAAAISAPGRHGGHGEGHRGPMLGDGMGGMHGFMGGRRAGERLKTLDTNGDGAITLEEVLARHATRFARMDKNADGAIDTADFDAIAKENTDYWVKRVMKRLDTDKDGKISKAEAEKMAGSGRGGMLGFGPDDGEGRRGEGRRGEGRGEGRGWGHGRRSGPDSDGAGQREGSGETRLGMWQSFRKEWMQKRITEKHASLDTDKDGFVDAKELAAAGASRKGRFQQRFLQRMDADKDGKVTRAEFDKPARERFARADLDDDGKITEADLPPMMRGRGILK